MQRDPAQTRLADLLGVELVYHDVDGNEQHAGPDALFAVLQGLDPRLERPDDAADLVTALENEAAHRLLPPVIVAWDGAWTHPVPGDAPGEWLLQMEGGGTRRGTLNGRELRLDHLPFGYHDLMLRVGTREAHARVITAPRRAFGERGEAARKHWGVFLPLYALHTKGSGGVGNFGTLRDLIGWVEERGGSVVGTLPMLSTWLDEPFQPSPYAPVSRLFWNELYLDFTQIPEWRAARPRTTPTRGVLPPDAPWVDYRAAMEAQWSTLSSLATFFFSYASPARRGAFERYLDTHPELDDYAQFRAATVTTGKTWGHWSSAAREGRLDNGTWDPHIWRVHAYAQWNAHQQLAALAESSRSRGLGLYLDLPLGVHPDGYDAWRFRHLFCPLSTGAPPDPLFVGGQNWGFPPLHPRAILEDGLDYFARVVRNHLRYAGVLRLDHVMGLHRLFCIPPGFAPTEGIYVRQPAEALYAVLTLESMRASATLIGEDLGTVPDAVRASMAEHGILRMHVQQFGVREDPGQPLESPAPDSIASLNTHDTPTFAGWWNGADVDDQLELELIDEDQARQARHGRERVRGLIGDWLQQGGWTHGTDEGATRDGLLRWLAESEARILLVNLEDLWGEARPQNTPGTTSAQRHNWCGRARYSLQELETLSAVTEMLASIDARRKGLLP